MRRCFFVCFSLYFLAATAFAQSPLASLKPEIEKLIAATAAEKVGVALYDLETKQIGRAHV